MSDSPNIHSEVIQNAATQFRIDANLIQAIMAVETHGECWKPRYEPAISDTALWSPRIFAEKLGISIITESMLQKMSWGPMQILGNTARWQGFTGDLPMLCMAEIGIFYGAKYLAHLCSKWPDDEPHVIAAYNGGPGVTKTPGGMWKNQSYVDAVYLHLRELRKLI